jgi:hypothetical protein
MSEKPQSFENHRKFVPLFAAVAGPILMINLGWAIYRLVQVPTLDNGVSLLVAGALLIVAGYARGFALTVQDRVIRLEMQVRMRQILPADQHGRIKDFTRDQLVALRFAGDAELPGLAAQVLRDNLQDKTAIKKMIKSWQADHLRA